MVWCQRPLASTFPRTMDRGTCLLLCSLSIHSTWQGGAGEVGCRGHNVEPGNQRAVPDCACLSGSLIEEDESCGYPDGGGAPSMGRAAGKGPAAAGRRCCLGSIPISRRGGEREWRPGSRGGLLSAHLPRPPAHRLLRWELVRRSGF